jgi:hypothetical protein
VEAAKAAIAVKCATQETLALVPAQPDYAAAAREELSKRMGSTFDYVSIRYSAQCLASDALAAAYRCQSGAGKMVPFVPTRVLPSWHSAPALDDMDVFAAACAQEVSMRAQDVVADAAAAATDAPEKPLARTTGPGAGRNERLRALASARAGLSKTTPPAAISATAEENHAREAPSARREGCQPVGGGHVLCDGGSSQVRAARSALAPAAHVAPVRKPANPAKKPAVAFGRRVNGESLVGRKKAGPSSSAPAAKRRAHAQSDYSTGPSIAAPMPTPAPDAAAQQAHAHVRKVHEHSHMRPPAGEPAQGEVAQGWPVHQFSHMRIEGPGWPSPPAGVAAQSGIPQVAPPALPGSPDAVTGEALVAILHGLTAVLQSKGTANETGVNADAVQRMTPQASDRASGASASLAHHAVELAAGPFSAHEQHVDNHALKTSAPDGVVPRSQPESAARRVPAPERPGDASTSAGWGADDRTADSSSSDGGSGSDCSLSSTGQDKRAASTAQAAASDAVACEQTSNAAMSAAHLRSAVVPAKGLAAGAGASDMLAPISDHEPDTTRVDLELTAAQQLGDVGNAEVPGLGLLGNANTSPQQPRSAAEEVLQHLVFSQPRRPLAPQLQGTTAEHAAPCHVGVQAGSATPLDPPEPYYRPHHSAQHMARVRVEKGDQALPAAPNAQAPPVPPFPAPLPVGPADRHFLSVRSLSDLDGPAPTWPAGAPGEGLSEQAQCRLEQFHALEQMLRSDLAVCGSAVARAALTGGRDTKAAADGAPTQPFMQTSSHPSQHAAHPSDSLGDSEAVGALLQQRLLEQLQLRHVASSGQAAQAGADAASPYGAAGQTLSAVGTQLGEAGGSESADGLRADKAPEADAATATAPRALSSRLRKTYAGALDSDLVSMNAPNTIHQLVCFRFWPC